MVRRLQKTLIDYMVIAISPALIMALVGSLVFFLLTVFYQGQYEARLTFIFAMFVIAAVLIGRISIEEGIEYATFFAVPLAAVTLLATYRFVEFHGALAGWSWLINIGLLALVWWCAHKLTWDCTVIDEHDDASDTGLLESLGLDQRKEDATADNVAGDLSSAASAAESKMSWWQRFVQRRRQRHVPGVWVIYFSLAALPLFGFGQWFIPVTDTANRLYTFQLFFVYVLAALGLLLTTRFLGLRRYLRQRRLEMPPDTAAIWLGVGGSLIVAMLIFCTVLPRPSAEYELAELPFAVGSPGDLRPSRHGLGDDGPIDTDLARRSRPDHELASVDDDSRGRSEETDDASRTGTERDSDEGNDSSSNELFEGDSQQRSRNDSMASDDDQRPQTNDTAARDGQKERDDGPQDRTATAPSQRETDESEQQSGRSRTLRDGNQRDAVRPSTERSISPPAILKTLTFGLAGLLKLLFYAAIIAVAAYLLWAQRDRVVASWWKFVDEIRQFFRRLFGARERQSDQEISEPAPGKQVPRPFSSFTDPFASGRADRVKPDELVRYTFEALEAWARERGSGREPDQTALEFAANLGKNKPTLYRDAVYLAELYSTVAYAEDALSRDRANHVRAIWQHFGLP